ncbi:MAG: hypothetical protein D8M59_10260 [Planctomycetes bacterium]|nr:hypothetical protein [Planctomycetota bacterium]NOG55226.1 S8 family serine peptidase [Planctomycetota bacterium]
MHNSVTAKTRHLMLWAGLAGALTMTAGVSLGEVDQESDVPVRYIEQPGYMEFSGSMIARPWPVEHWQEKGLSLSRAQVQYDRALALLSDNYDISNYYPQTDYYVFSVPMNSDENLVADTMLETGLFKYVHPNWAVYPTDCPDDPRLGQQWHHNANRLNSCLGWDYETGDPTEIAVGICDTGIRVSHEDLQLHRLEGYNAVDQLWESEGGQINDIYGHGTETTGCAAANGNNGIGVSGVCWDLSHRMLRVTNSGGGGSTIEILNHAASVAIENGCKVASLSYSGVMNEATKDTATYIKSIGGLMIWAAGNSGQNMTLNDRDADDVIVVGATDSGDNKASFSNYGPFVDFTAPGVGVYTTAYNGDSNYRAVDGTSFACPLTSGLACLIWSRNPSLTPDEVEQLIKQYCDDLGSPGIDNTFGYGRINVFNSITQVSHAFDFSYPNGLPDMISPDGSTAIRVELTPQDEEPAPGTGMLHYNTGAGWNSVAMRAINQYTYDAYFPAIDCLTAVDYYFSADTIGGETITDPSGAPTSAYATFAAQGNDVAFTDDFETDTGWRISYSNLSTGFWARVVPNANGGPGTPPADFDGSGKCWVTDNGGYRDVDGGPTRLMSPAFGLSDGTAIVSYAYWMHSVNGTPDTMDVQVSNDGGNSWTTAAQHAHGSGWTEYSFDVSDFVTPSADMHVRFLVSDNPDDSTTEAAIDAFMITESFCDRMVLDVPPLNSGQNATLTAKNGTANAETYFVYSLRGRGFRYVNSLNVVIDLTSPDLAGSSFADGTGMAELIVSVPNGASGKTVWLQAVQSGRKSTAVEATVN